MLSLLLAAALAPDEVDVDDIPQTPQPCSVEWASDAFPDFVEITEPRIHQRCQDLVETLEFEGDPGSIEVEILGELLQFQVKVSLVRGDERVYEGMPTDVCECGSNELATATMKEVVAAIEAVEKDDDISTVLEPAPPKGTDASSQTPKNEPNPKHTLRWAGIGVGVAGLGLGVAGAVLMPREQVVPRLSEGALGTEVVRRYPLALTGALVGVGSLGMIAGITMVIVDSKRSRSAARRTSVAPMLDGRQVGFSLTGTF